MRLRVAVVVFLCISFPFLVASQTNPNLAIGITPYGSYSAGNIDSISLLNGNLSVRVPLFSYPQRGSLTANVAITYEDKNWYVWEHCNDTENPCTLKWMYSSWNPGGIRVGFDQPASTSFAPLAPKSLVTLFTARTGDGATHMMLPDAAGGYRTVDGSGIWNNGATTQGPYITKGPDGVTYNNTTTEDPNGNALDSLNRTLSTNGTADTTGCIAPAEPVQVGAALWNTPGQNATSRMIKICTASFNISFDSGSTETIDANQNADTITPGSATVTLIVSIILYNGTSWTTSPAWAFDYSSAGSLTKVTFPTGGTITYAWGSSQVCPNNAGLTPYGLAVESRTIDAQDGTGPHTTQYVYGPGYTVVTDPSLNDTKHTFTDLISGTCSLYETQTQFYQGSYTAGTLLKTITTDYQSKPNPYSTVLIPPSAVNVFPIRVTTTWPNGQTSKVETSYDTSFVNGNTTYSYGKVLTVKEYDYGNGAAGPLVRTSTNAYLPLTNSSYLAANLLNLVSSSTITNGAGTQVAKTAYTYDGNTLQSAGITTQRDTTLNTTAAGIRGNLTSVCRWLNTTGGNLCTNTKYFDTGMPYTVTNPASNVTTFAYSSAYAGAYLTQTMLPQTGTVQHLTSATYDFNTGQVASSTDQNSKVTNYTYDALGRTLTTSFADGGATTLSYNDVALSSSAEQTQAITSSPSLSSDSLVYVDGLGRRKQTKLASDPDGATFADTTYDAVGHVRTQSNPHRSASATTDGTTTTFYDALGRVCLVVPPDGTLPAGNTCPATQPANTIFTSYSGSATTVTDQAGKSRKSVADGLGRLTQVFEDPAGLNYETDYSYDALNNLLTVNQKGGTTDSTQWRTRTFTYDSLSRLLTATNPESGTITYTYDNNGNLATKTSPAPNQTGSATVVATYTYDALNRLTQKSFNDGATPTVQYIYDGNAAPTGCTFPTLTITNPVGRRTGMCDVAGSEVWAYDSLGHVLFDQRKTNGITKQFAYTYNLDGSVATLTHPSTSPNDVWPTHSMPLTFTQGGAGRYTSVSDGGVNFAYNVQYSPSGAECYWKQNWGSLTTTDITFNNRLQPMRIYESADSGVTPPTPCQAPTVGTNLPMDFIYNYTDASGHNNGNVQQITNNTWGTRSQTFTYDSLNRLASAQTTGTPATDAANCWSEAYSYDPWGNLLKLGPSGSSSYTGCSQESGFDFSAPGIINTKNQIAASGYGYDAAGNLTTNPGVGTQTFNAENQLVAAGGQTYAYDGDGNRIWKAPAATPNSPTWIYWYGGSGSSVLQESDGSGFGQYSHIYFNGRRASRMEWKHLGFNDHYGYDALGNVRWVYGGSSSAASVWDISDYYPFGGERRVKSGTDNDFKFTGKERDTESGLDNFGVRYNSSSMGRLMSPDPVLISTRRKINPQIWNAYSYAGNNPLNYVDPTGEELVQLGQHTDDEIKKRQKEIKQELKNKDLSKDQKNALKNENNTLSLEKQGNQVVGNLLSKLDQTGERNGLQLSNFTLSTDTKNDFAGAATPEALQKLVNDQAFVIQNNKQFSGTIYIRTEPETGFYQLSQRSSDFAYFGASSLSHEQVHLNGGGEYPAYQRQLGVFEGFQNFFQNPAIYRGLDESIRDGIKANQPQ